jgi:proteic killer suppression protein
MNAIGSAVFLLVKDRSNVPGVKSLPSFDTWHVSCYIYVMIVSFRHKGLQLFATKGDRSKVQQSHVAKIRLIISRLNRATEPEMMNQAGYYFHSLKGDLKGFYSVRVSGNWRIIFRFDGENAAEVDYIDYH